MPDYARIYTRQEYLTPGAAETVEIIAETVQPTEQSLLLDVACGKGEAAATLAGMERISLDEYAGLIEASGLHVDRTHVHERSAWDEYWRPMLEVAHEAKTSQPADIAFADDVESGVALERRAADQYIDYATFVATKP